MQRKKPRILLVYKKDAFQQYVLERQDSHLLSLLRKGQSDVLDLRRSHEVHQQAVESVLRHLRRAHAHVDMAARAELHVTKRYDLVVSVGGDGTFLQAARSLANTPILGVNSNPERSEAVFSAATIATFPWYLLRALEGKLSELRLCCLRLCLNGRQLPHRVVNDVLLANDHPATMSRYRLDISRRRETQKSSGLWVATAAGSGSAALAAGGQRLPWDACRFQYRPRELYRGRLSRYALLGGVLSQRTPIRVTWLMRQGHVFVDGSHVNIPLQFADVLEIRLSSQRQVRALGLVATASGRRASGPC